MANGTTTAMYFATIHKEASLVLADIAHQFGQRAFIGKVSMDQNSPGYYIENTEDAIKEVEDFITTLISKKVFHKFEIHAKVGKFFPLFCSIYSFNLP